MAKWLLELIWKFILAFISFFKKALQSKTITRRVCGRPKVSDLNSRRVGESDVWCSDREAWEHGRSHFQLCCSVLFYFAAFWRSNSVNTTVIASVCVCVCIWFTVCENVEPVISQNHVSVAKRRGGGGVLRPHWDMLRSPWRVVLIVRYTSLTHCLRLMTKPCTLRSLPFIKPPALIRPVLSYGGNQ